MSDQQQANGQNNNPDQNSGQQTVWETVTDQVDSCKKMFSSLWRVLGEDFGLSWPEQSSITLALWIFAIIIDPLAFYIPGINSEQKKLTFDLLLLIIIVVLYSSLCIYKLSINVFNPRNRSKSKSWWAFVLLAPFVPVIANVVLQPLLFFQKSKEIRATIFSVGMAIYLILYLARVLGIYRLFIATTLRKSAILRLGINFLLYLYGCHLFGGLWYFFAVWKKMQCWHSVCKSHAPDCNYEHGRFIVRSGGRFLDDICNYNNSTEGEIYDWGIFQEAFESHVLEIQSFGKKLLYCFRWGTQNISNYGQGLVSTRAWENIFVILIAIYGLATFTFFLGNMQNFIMSSTSKSDKGTRWTRRNLENWHSFRKFSQKEQDSIVDICQRCKWPQTGAVNIKNLLNNLPKDAENDIKRILCLELLKREEIKLFDTLGPELLDELCGCAKLVTYEKHAQIVQNGRSIDKMFLVVEGKLRSYSTSTNADSPGTPAKTKIKDLEDGSFCGEELVDWFQNDPNSCLLPKSTRTIRVVEQVDGFALMSYNLQNVFIERQAALAST